MSKDGEALMGEMEQQASGFTPAEMARAAAGALARRNNAMLRVDAWIEYQKMIGAEVRKQDAPAWTEYEAAEAELAGMLGGTAT